MPKSKKTVADAETEAKNFESAEDLRAALRRSQQALFKAKSKNEDLVAAIYQATVDATLAMGPIKAVQSPKADRRHRAEAANWILGDWQGGKWSTSYDLEVMRARVKEYVRIAERITSMHRADHPIKDCIIVFLGDMVEGPGFNFPTQALEIVPGGVFTQIVNVSRLMVETVREALRIYETVTVIAEPGNHGRIGSKRDCISREDNFDRISYEMARQQLSGECRLTWNDCPEDIQRLEYKNYRCLVAHGDEVGRNGFASKAAIVQHVNRWRSGAYRVNGKPWIFRDTLIGHYHSHEEATLANGEGSVYLNGSTESDNRYASVNLAASAIPSQRLHFIDGERGRVTATYKIWLADDGSR